MSRRSGRDSWAGIARLGLSAGGNRGRFIVLNDLHAERGSWWWSLALPAMIPGALVGSTLPCNSPPSRMGFGSDQHGRRIPWIIGGIGAGLCLRTGAAAATALMATEPPRGIPPARSWPSPSWEFGVSASSTPFLAFLAERVDEDRMAVCGSHEPGYLMIVGIIITAGVAGSPPGPLLHRSNGSGGDCRGVRGGHDPDFAPGPVVGRKDDGVVVKGTLRSSSPQAGLPGRLPRDVGRSPVQGLMALFIFVL